MTLNLGAGNRILEGAVNHDIRKHRPEIDVVWDLDDLPWPWDDCSFTSIHAIDVFEHLKICLIEALDQCWRILKPNGRLTVKYPLFDSPLIHEDPTHRWFWGPGVLDYFDPKTRWGRRYGYYTDCHWEILEKRTIRGKIGGKSLQATLVPRKKVMDCAAN